jgi:hypothetical protein
MRARTVFLAVAATAAVAAAVIATILLAQPGTEQGAPLATKARATPRPATASPSHSPTSGTATPGGTAEWVSSDLSAVYVAQVLGAGSLDAELIVVRNRGERVNLEGWTLSVTKDDSFVFPDLTLYPGGEVRVRSASGDSGPTVLYWARTAPAWESGDLVTLRDARGNKVYGYLVP